MIDYSRRPRDFERRDRSRERGAGFGAFPGRGGFDRGRPMERRNFDQGPPRRDFDHDRRDFGRGNGYGNGGNRKRRVNTNLIDLDPNVIPLDKRPRRVNNWDDRPTGLDGVAAVDILMSSGIHVIPYDQSKGARNEAEKTAIIAAILNTIHEEKKLSNDRVTSEMKEKCRQLLLLDLNTNVKEDDIFDFFKNMLVTYRCIPSNSKHPVVDVKLDKEKHLAVVEFRGAEEATSALAFDGALFKQKHLRIRRPRDFLPLPGEPLEPPSINIAGITSSYVPNTYNRIIIGGIPKSLPSEKMMELLQCFGDLRAFTYVYEPKTNVWNGYAFCEFVDLTLTDLVCDGLNSLEVEDSILKVQRSTRNCPRIDLASVIPEMIPKTLLGPISTSVEPTNIVQILNVLSLEDIADDQEYLDIMEDVRDEAAEFGRVEKVFIPRPFDECYYPGSGRIYVVFDTVDGAKRAVEGLAGRIYNNRVVFTSFYPTFKFDCYDF